MFPSPYSGILFLWLITSAWYSPISRFPSPYSGILFLCLYGVNTSYDSFNVSVPLFGDSFFIERKRLINAAALMLFPSPYSGILFLSFVCGLTVTRIAGVLVSVPLFGDSFFIAVEALVIDCRAIKCFRPLIRGFFFYSCYRDWDKWGWFHNGSDGI